MKQHSTIWNKERKRWMQSMQKDWQPIENKIYLHLNIFFRSFQHWNTFQHFFRLECSSSFIPYFSAAFCAPYFSLPSLVFLFFVCVILVTFSWLFLVSVYFNLSPSHSWSLSHSLCAPFFSLSQIHSCYFFLARTSIAYAACWFLTALPLYYFRSNNPL